MEMAEMVGNHDADDVDQELDLSMGESENSTAGDRDQAGATQASTPVNNNKMSIIHPYNVNMSCHAAPLTTLVNLPLRHAFTFALLLYFCVDDSFVHFPRLLAALMTALCIGDG
jgi:hypothetical protein